MGYEQLRPWMPEAAARVEDAVADQIEIAAKYAGYIDRQKEEVARQQAQENVTVPSDFDYASVKGLSIEVRQKLAHHRPETVGQASRIQGVTPAAISLLLVHLKRRALAAAPRGQSAA